MKILELNNCRFIKVNSILSIKLKFTRMRKIDSEVEFPQKNKKERVRVLFDKKSEKYDKKRIFIL